MVRAYKLCVSAALTVSSIDRAQASWRSNDPDAVLKLVEWNVHYQCGSYAGCREAAAKKIVKLTQDADADFVVAIELEYNASAPLDIPSFGLLGGWSQVAGTCPSTGQGHAGDALAVLLAPGTTLLAEDGGCLNLPGDSSRAFAVALVIPRVEVSGCEAVCVVGLHAPHHSIVHGQDIIANVCGDATTRCMVAAGDWNAIINLSDWPKDRPAPLNPRNVSELWKQLVPGSSQLTAQAPEAVTCCYPESKYFGFDDHVVTNIPGAYVVNSTVFPYQMMGGGAQGNDTEEHKPVSVTIGLTSAPDDGIILV